MEKVKGSPQGKEGGDQGLAVDCYISGIITVLLLALHLQHADNGM